MLPSASDFHYRFSLLSFLFKKGSKELWYFCSDYQRHVKFYWGSSWNSGPFPALSPTHTQNWVSCGLCGLKHTWGALTESAQVPHRGVRQSSVSNLESGKNRLGKKLIENGNEGDVLVTSANHCVVYRRAYV